MNMPRGDGTGPLGLGPMTGRGAGYCAGYSVPGCMNPGIRFGRGLGLGFRRGFGFRRFFPVYQPVARQANLTKEDEIKMLEEERRYLQEEIRAIENEKMAIQEELKALEEKLKKMKK